jgi:general secretion pathway protein G
MMRSARGFTLIELLIVVAIIGIIAAIAIPNLMSAISRGRQKRTMSDMRTIAVAIEAYAVDFSFYPQAANMDDLKRYIDGPYARHAPSSDGWAGGFNLTCTSFSYTIISYGRDRVPSAITHGRKTDDFDCDIAFSNGSFSQWPEGIQVEG